jgi:hypothetical protein
VRSADGYRRHRATLDPRIGGLGGVWTTPKPFCTSLQRELHRVFLDPLGGPPLGGRKGPFCYYIRDNLSLISFLPKRRPKRTAKTDGEELRPKTVVLGSNQSVAAKPLPHRGRGGYPPTPRGVGEGGTPVESGFYS